MKKKNRIVNAFQFAQFGMIGLLNAAVDIGTLNLLMILWPTNGSQTLILYNTIAYTLTIINSYIWNSKFTFKKHAKFSMKEIILFIIQAAVSLVISNVVFIVGIYLIGLFAIPQWLVRNIAKGLAMVLSSTASFFFMKYFVFRKKEGKVSYIDH